VRIESASSWTGATLTGGDGLEDGFSFVRDAQRATILANEIVRLVDEDSGSVLAWVTSTMTSEWFTAIAPGAPNTGERRFILVRWLGDSARLRTVWDWNNSLRAVTIEGSALRLTETGGTIVDCEWMEDGARITHAGADARTTVLSGFREREAGVADASAPLEMAVHALPYARELGEPDYRMSERDWAQAGQPRAHVVIDADASEVEIRVEVRKSSLHFRDPDAADPLLDNEHPDINSDGVQLHLWCEGWREPAAWLAIPERAFAHTRLRRTDGGASGPSVTADSRESIGGYEVRFVVPRASLCDVVAIDVLVNEMSAGRQRRRGQLVLSGARGDRVYLRGDRQPREHFIRVRLPE
jgi:hypothetical protein